jgi:hypothetical protein
VCASSCGRTAATSDPERQADLRADQRDLQEGRRSRRRDRQDRPRATVRASNRIGAEYRASDGPRAVKRIRKRYPNLKMDINVLRLEEVIDYLLLRQGRLRRDQLSPRSSGVGLPLASGPLFLHRAGEPRAGAAQAHLGRRDDELSADRRRADRAYGRIMSELFVRHKLPYDITIRARFGNTVCSLVQAGLGLAVIDQFSVAHGCVPGVRLLEIRSRRVSKRSSRSSAARLCRPMRGTSSISCARRWNRTANRAPHALRR